jgi:hypothetical protein
MAPIRYLTTTSRLLCIASVAITLGCRRDESPSRATPPPSSSSAAPLLSSSVAPPPAPDRSSADVAPAAPTQADAGASPEGAAELPRTAVVLDPEKGKRALGDYRKFLKSFCRALQGDAGDAAARLKRIGLEGAEELFLCAGADDAGAAVASGSFELPGADEVLLSVPSGMPRASGDHALAVMRNDGTSYRLVRHLVIGNDTFEARVRVVTASGKDILMLCHHHGQMNLYQGTCGFLGRGSFQRAPRGPAANDELELVNVTACGPGASVSLGGVRLRGWRLLVELVVERFVLERSGEAEREGDFCSRKVLKSQARFDIDYELDGDHFRRVTAIPREVVDVLKQR